MASTQRNQQCTSWHLILRHEMMLKVKPAVVHHAYQFVKRRYSCSYPTEWQKSSNSRRVATHRHLCWLTLHRSEWKKEAQQMFCTVSAAYVVSVQSRGSSGPRSWSTAQRSCPRRGNVALPMGPLRQRTIRAVGTRRWKKSSQGKNGPVKARMDTSKAKVGVSALWGAWSFLLVD